MPQLRDTSDRGRHDIRTIQELLGHKDVTTTMIYTQGVKSPLDRLYSAVDKKGHSDGTK